MGRALPSLPGLLEIGKSSQQAAQYTALQGIRKSITILHVFKISCFIIEIESRTPLTIRGMFPKQYSHHRREMARRLLKPIFETYPTWPLKKGEFFIPTLGAFTYYTSVIQLRVYKNLLNFHKKTYTAYWGQGS